MNKQVETIRAKIEERMTENCALAEKADCFGQRAVEDNDILSFIDSLPDEKKEWISVEDSLPPIEQEVIVLSDYIHGKYVKDAHAISFGHRPNPDGWTGKNIDTGEVKHYEAVTYDGWNIPGVTHWIPCPPVPDEDPARYEVKNAMKNLDEKIKLASKTWEGVDVDEYMGEVRYGKEPTSDDLKDEIARYLREECSADDEPSISDIARHFAEWGAKHGKK